MVGVGLPVMILAGIATYFNSRASIARQSPEAAANPQTAIMNRLMLYVFPFGVVVGGVFLPLAIIFYWFANNIWTFGQQHYVFGMIEKEEEAKKLEAQERRAANAPPPGAKPNRARKAQTAADRRSHHDVESDGKTELGTDGEGARVKCESSRVRAIQRAAPHRALERLRARARGPRNGNVDRSTTRWMRERQT